MKLGRAIPLWILILILSSVIVFAQVDVTGKWDSTENSCNCTLTLNIWTESDGSLKGQMNFPGAQSPPFTVALNGDQISFSVDEPVDDQSVTYIYNATVTSDGNRMAGTFAKQEDSSSQLKFSATRRTAD